MNRIHRSLWNARRQTHVAVAETACSRGKPSSLSAGGLAASALVLSLSGVLTSGAAHAAGAPVASTTLPTGAQVQAGAAQISRSEGGTGAAMTITQTTPRAAINWGSFSVGANASVQFVQPDISSVALNRVTGREATVIDGRLSANGQVFILNPSGVLFGAGARVDTAGLLASTLNVSDADFMAGRTRLSGDSRAAVVNQGTLTARDGGYVALVGQQVRNDGLVSATLGNVSLAAGRAVSLNFNGNSLVGVTVTEAALAALVANGGALQADGGQVLLTAKAAEGLLDTVVNNTGTVRAQTIAEHSGKILLLGEGGAVEVAGSLDASAPAGTSGTVNPGHGGFIETSAPRLLIHDGTVVNTRAAPGSTGRSGTWLIDPTDFTIGTGSAAQTTSGMGAATLEAALTAGDVTIQTAAAGTGNGDINVNAPVAWSDHKLSLQAHGDINVNAVMSVNGTATVDLKTRHRRRHNVRQHQDPAHGHQRGWHELHRAHRHRPRGHRHPQHQWFGLPFDRFIGTQADVLDGSPAMTLQGMARTEFMNQAIALSTDIDARATASWGATADGYGSGFFPIGTVESGLGPSSLGDSTAWGTPWVD